MKYLNDDDSLIFKYIKPNDNDKFSKMNGLDLQDLLILINQYYLQLRDQLGFKKYITFGLEIEYENIKTFDIEDRIYEAFPHDDWVVKEDGSLVNGEEINSPVLKDSVKTWSDLNKVCSIVEPLASIGRKAGGHIHIGTQTLGEKESSWLNFIKLWSVYENIIYRFVYGEFLTARPSMGRYAEPMSESFWNDYESLKRSNSSLEVIIDIISHQRRQAVNFYNVYSDSCNKYHLNNTIEFRCPNGSLDPIIWQNNVNLFVNMLLYSKSRLFDNDIVEKRHNLITNKFFNLKWYDEIYLEQALEFCDMIFHNNYDKVYFLRQYLKSFETTKLGMEYPKASSFTKKLK